MVDIQLPGPGAAVSNQELSVRYRPRRSRARNPLAAKGTRHRMFYPGGMLVIALE